MSSVESELFASNACYTFGVFYICTCKDSVHMKHDDKNQEEHLDILEFNPTHEGKYLISQIVLIW